MKIFNLSFILTCFLVLTVSCTSKDKSFEDDEFSTEAEASLSNDDLNLDEALGEQTAETTDAAPTAETKLAEKDAGKDSVADEFAEFEDTKIDSANTAATTEDDLEKEMNLLDSPAAEVAKNDNPVPQIPVAPEIVSDVPAPEVTSEAPPKPTVSDIAAVPVQPQPEDIPAMSAPTRETAVRPPCRYRPGTARHMRRLPAHSTGTHNRR